MNWRDIPSLSALRAFEAAARTGSLSAAARELNVTHAAIAQHVRTLEAHFGRTLLTRDGQRMVPTDAGEDLALALGDGFGKITAGVRALTDRDRTRPLRVALTPSFAANWLMHRIGGFWADHPEIGVELLPSNGLVDLRRDEVDLAIRYGRGGWPGVDAQVLMSAGLAAVAAPGYVAGPVERLGDLTGRTWLLDATISEERLWARDSGIDLDVEKVRILSGGQLVLAAARAGLGIAILPGPSTADAVAEGTLTVLAAETDSATAYHLLTRPGTGSPALTAFIRWLHRTAAAAPGLGPAPML